MAKGDKFLTIRAARRIWVVGAIHGDIARLSALHDLIARHVRYGDRIVYSGNAIGLGLNSVAVVNELLRFRRWFLSMPPYNDRNDVVYLRGAQEEMWQKVHQLQFAPKPEAVLDWALPHGLEATLRSYGADPQEGYARIKEGTLALTYWTSELMDAVHSAPGHDNYYASLKHAAATADAKLLFVNSGLDPDKAVVEQGDLFWWASRRFTQMSKAYNGFSRVIRGYDNDHGGFRETDFSLTVDGGCGFGGPLITACVNRSGEVEDLLKV